MALTNFPLLNYSVVKAEILSDSPLYGAMETPRIL